MKGIKKRPMSIEIDLDFVVEEICEFVSPLQGLAPIWLPYFYNHVSPSGFPQSRRDDKIIEGIGYNKMQTP